ncbi:efflux RND transporter periplasmic adaptor subunit [Akkermansiaceae bacterium]|nr:efflux RND transporter periplasmic adaptor subunit [Akkermansiaceae bacterium]MDB4537105.1 efflux RND transporter periplasmic adaptor subunit [Akkermansiaceae bacterium]
MKHLLQKRFAIPAAAIAAIILAILIFGGNDEEGSQFYHTVQKGNFVISVVEGGSLDAVNEVVVKNAIDGESRIIWLIPEGTYVKKGDLLVEFDAGGAESEVEEQQVKFEARQAALVKAENDLIITKSTAESDLAEAELELKFATMDRVKFETLEKIHDIENSELNINTAEETLKLSEQKFEWSQKLAEKGFETQTQVDRDKLEVTRNDKAVKTARSSHQMLEQFDLKKKEEEYISKEKEATAKLARVRKESESKIAQQQAEVNSAMITLDLTKDGLEKKIEQLKATKVYAPQSGLAIYPKPNRYSRDTKIEEGAEVRNRTTLIKIPDVTAMKVVVKIHESMISQIKKGQSAYVVLDSIPDQRFSGTVTKVAILPDSDRSWNNPDLKVYKTEIVINEQIENIKPGVSARAEIIIEELQDVLTVPIQAVTTLDGQQVCYMEKGGELEAVPVEIGLFNTKYIQIKSGLEQGDEVVLNPPLDSKLNLTGNITEDPESESE